MVSSFRSRLDWNIGRKVSRSKPKRRGVIIHSATLSLNQTAPRTNQRTSVFVDGERNPFHRYNYRRSLARESSLRPCELREPEFESHVLPCGTVAKFPNSIWLHFPQLCKRVPVVWSNSSARHQTIVVITAGASVQAQVLWWLCI